jgi:predicted ATP-grasp superfamily ATP-dependent carboligase
MSVLITQAQSRLAYLASKCLAEQGVEVVCASEFPLAACFFSRYCSSHFVYPSPWEYPEQFVDTVITEIKKREIEVLMPVHREGYILSRYKDELDSYVKFPYPPYSKIVSVNDKRRLFDTAKQAEVRIPKTIIPESLEDVEEASSNLQYPIVIKLSRGHGSIGRSIVEEPSRLLPQYHSTVERFNLTPEEYPIIQEFIQGQNLCLGMLFNNGALRAEFSACDPREFYCFEFEHKESTMLLSRLGRHLRWHGILHGEFLIDDSGTPYLIDVNPRFWGRLPLAVISGVDFPYLLYCIGRFGDTEPVLEYRRGLESRWFWGDLFNVLKSLMRGEWSRAARILTCGVPLETWNTSDLAPFFLLPVYPLFQLLKSGSVRPFTEKY